MDSIILQMILVKLIGL